MVVLESLIWFPPFFGACPKSFCFKERNRSGSLEAAIIHTGDEGLSDAPSRLPPPLLDDDEDEDMEETATSEIQG